MKLVSAGAGLRQPVGSVAVAILVATRQALIVAPAPARAVSSGYHAALALVAGWRSRPGSS